MLFYACFCELGADGSPVTFAHQAIGKNGHLDCKICYRPFPSHDDDRVGNDIRQTSLMFARDKQACLCIRKTLGRIVYSVKVFFMFLHLEPYVSRVGDVRFCLGKRMSPVRET